MKRMDPTRKRDLEMKPPIETAPTPTGARATATRTRHVRRPFPVILDCTTPILSHPTGYGSSRTRAG